MDIAVLFEALGGGPGAVAIVVLGWFGKYQMSKVDALSEMLMDRKDDEIRAATQREIATHQALEVVTDLVNDLRRNSL